MTHGLEGADRDGLGAAYLAHGGELLRYARRSLHDAQLAEDAVQETFARAWRSRSSFDPEVGSMRPWLFAIERRVIIDLSRKRANHKEESLDEGLVSTQDGIDLAMRGWQVEEALRRLKPEHRLVLVRTYFGQCSGRELAMELRIPEGTVRSRLYYALKTLRLTLDEMGWEW